jgi:hypothetical protein
MDALERHGAAGVLGDNADQMNDGIAAGHRPIEGVPVKQTPGEGLHARVGSGQGVLIDQGMNIESALEQPSENR